MAAAATWVKKQVPPLSEGEVTGDKDAALLVVLVVQLEQKMGGASDRAHACNGFGRARTRLWR